MNEDQVNYGYGWNAGLEAAAALLGCVALRRGVTLAELAEHLRLMKIPEPPSQGTQEK